MANSFTQSKLQKLLQEVPEDIKEWIGSEKITNTIIKLNKKLGLKDEKIKTIPRLMLKLETKELHPAEFIEEIAHSLDIGMKSANMIAEEIKEEILDPIEPSLKQWGVNIDLIEPELSESASKTKINVKDKNKKRKPVSKIEAEEQKEEVKKEGKQIPISSSPKSKLKTPTDDSKQEGVVDKDKPQKEMRPKSTAKGTDEETSDSKPFMIHQESGFDQKESKGGQSKGKRKRKKSFSFSKDGFFDSNKSKKEDKSPKAEIGTPGSSKEKKKGGGIFGFGGKEKEKERVVHYSDNRTDLSDDGSNKFINLSNLEPTSPKNKKRKQKKKSNINKQNTNKKADNKQSEKNKSSKDSSFLGNIDESNVNKKDYKKEDNGNKKKNEGDGPHVDGNTVDLSQN